MSEEVTVTVLDLLNLALGTPEIGAVNFNLLHRFLLELVKHFSLARKQIDITDDIAVQAALEETKLMSAPRSQIQLFPGYSSLSEADGKRSSEVPGKESFTAMETEEKDKNLEIKGGNEDNTASETEQREMKSTDEKNKKDETAKQRTEREMKSNHEKDKKDETAKQRTEKDTKSNDEKDKKDETAKQHTEREMKSNDEKDKKDETAKQRTEKETKSNDEKDKKDETAKQHAEREIKSTDEKDKKDETAKQHADSILLRRSPVVKSRSPSPQSRNVSAVTKGSKRSSPGTSRNDIRRKSFLEMTAPGIIQLERKISILEAKIEALGATPTNLEIVQQARDLQRDSSTSNTTAAGDMWHTMNIVRRIEVAEGAINGMTAMLDDISEQLRNMKDNSLEQRLDELSSEPKKNLEKKQSTKNIDDEDLEQIQKKLSAVDEKLSGMVCKNDLKKYVTVEKMNKLVDLKLRNIHQAPPIQTAAPTDAGNEQETTTQQNINEPETTEQEINEAETTEAKTTDQDTTEAGTTEADTTEAGTTKAGTTDQDTTDQDTTDQDTTDQDSCRLNRNTEAVQELVQNWSEFREKMSQKIAEILERLSNAVDKSALLDLKTEISELLESRSRSSSNKQESLVGAEDLQKLKNIIEKKLQSTEKDLEEMKKNFFSFYEMKATVADLKDSEDLMKCDIEKIQKELLKVTKQLEDEQEARCSFGSSSGRKHSFNISDSEELHNVRAGILEMRNEIEKLAAAMGQILDDQNKKQLHLDALYGHVDHLENIKADRQQLNQEIDVKADRKDLEKKISQDKFNNSIGCLDQSVQDLMQKLVGHEASLKQAINHITSDVNSKLDKVDLNPMKNYFEDKLKDLHSRVEKKPNEEKTSAAGTRSLLLQNANCISCDRPVKVYREGAKLPSLPFAKSFPGSKSSRAVTTFELADVRQQMFQGQSPHNLERLESLGQTKVQNELVKLGAIKDVEDLPELPNRPCGGNHTLTCPEKRTTIRINKAYREDLHFIAQLSQKDLSIVDILGYDGHVYKGHVTQLPAIPEIPKTTMGRRSTSGSGRPRTSSPV